MSRRNLLERLDDAVSPIVVKELRQAVQSKLVIVVLLMFLLFQVLVLGGTLLFSEARTVTTQLDFNRGKSLFLWLHGFMLGACMLVPIYVGVRLALERSDTNVDLLFISTLRPWSILHGKFLSGVMLLVIIISACSPFLTFTYLLRGLDVPTILTVLLIDLGLSLCGLALAIFLAVIPVPLVMRLFLGLVGLSQIVYLAAGGMALAYEIVMRGGGFARREFWMVFTAAAIPMLAGMGQLFSWSLALLSPPSSNRALPMGLYLLGVVVFMGAGAYVACGIQSSYLPLTVWLTVVALMVCTQLFITVNERESQGPRVARVIPRNPLLRLPTFLLYSGSAGGVLFTTLVMLGSIGFALLVIVARGDHQLSAGTMTAGSGTDWNDVTGLFSAIRFALVTYLYTYCFCVTAAAIRSTAFKHAIRPGFTWLVTLLLLGLGSVGPYMLAFFVMDRADRGRLERDDHILLPNPFVAVDNAMSASYYGESRDPFDMECMPFLVVWTTVATAAAAYWGIRQLKGFRPLIVKPLAA